MEMRWWDWRRAKIEERRVLSRRLTRYYYTVDVCAYMQSKCELEVIARNNFEDVSSLSSASSLLSFLVLLLILANSRSKARPLCIYAYFNLILMLIHCWSAYYASYTTLLMKCYLRSDTTYGSLIYAYGKQLFSVENSRTRREWSFLLTLRFRYLLSLRLHGRPSNTHAKFCLCKHIFVFIIRTAYIAWCIKKVKVSRLSKSWFDVDVFRWRTLLICYCTRMLNMNMLVLCSAMNVHPIFSLFWLNVTICL